MGVCCSSTTSAFRFKNFVVAVYPIDHDGELNKDALGKLLSYVANNVERIPRVCRKISKLVDVDLKRGDVKRVSIGMQILRHLLDEATELDAYVPYATAMCLTLFENGVVEHRISAADVLTALCHRIVERSDDPSGGADAATSAPPRSASSPPQPHFRSVMTRNSRMEHARRLVADSKDKFTSYLRDMLVEGVGTNDIISLHCRYAAMVALGNIAYCIQSSISAPSMVELVPPVLSNLHHLLREAAATMSSRVNQRRRQRKENISILSDDAVAEYRRAAKTVVLPVEAGEKDAALYKACVATIASLAMCCNTTVVPTFLSTVSQYCTTYHGWLLSRFPLVVFRTITVALQQKPQQPLGINVCAHLCEVAEEKGGTEHYASVLRALAVSVAQIPMSGGRPAPVIAVLKAALVSGFCLRPTALRNGSPSDATSSEVIYEDYRQALVHLCDNLVKRMAAHGNVVQVSTLASELCSLLRSSRALPRVALKAIFQMLMMVGPLVADVDLDVPALDDAGSGILVVSGASGASSGGLEGSSPPSTNELCLASSHLVVQAIAAYLLSSDGEICGMAGHVLATIIASDEPSSLPMHPRATAAASPVPPSWTLSHTRQSIVDDAKCWISHATFRTTNHTPLSVIGVTNVLTSLVHRLQWESLSYVIPWIVYVQRVNAVSSNREAVAASPGSATAGSPSSSKNTALQQAWLFASVVVLKVVGDLLHIPSLSRYALDVIDRRRGTEPCEIGLWFRPTLHNCTYTTSGMAEESGEQETPLAPLTVAGVTNLITLSTVVVYLYEMPGSAVFLRGIDSTKDNAVERIEAMAADIQRPQRRAKQSQRSVDQRLTSAKRTASSQFPGGAGRAAGIPVSQSFGDLVKREDSFSSGIPGGSLQGGGSVVVMLPRMGSYASSAVAHGSNNSAPQLLITDDALPASEKVHLVLQKLKADIGNVSSVESSSMTGPIPFQYPHLQNHHVDPFKDVDDNNNNASSRNGSFVLSSSGRGWGTYAGETPPLGGSIVMPTAKTLRLHRNVEGQGGAAFDLGATMSDGGGLGGNPAQRRLLQILEL